MSDRPDPLVGEVLGKVYRVLEPIGIGGMAVVYLVEHQTLLKRFAAKVLSPELADSLEARARFIQEAHAASQLDHENIVSISDFGTTSDQRPYFVMELLRGETLDRRLASGPMSIEEAVAVAVPVARALAHAHAEGVVHLDIKPENIFLVQRSRGRWGVKVVDFGIAKTPLNPRLNKLGETAGSPMFMAPEVCRGDDDVDQRADVYSFGILLYLMLCGRLPFEGDSTQRVLQMQLVELPPPPREVNTQLLPEVAIVLERALAKNRADRYPSMEALLSDLAAALPPGSDRLLIEAQSGAAAHETPFSGSLSLPRTETPVRMSSVPPISPLAPRRAAAPLAVIVIAVIAASVGFLTWRKLEGSTGGRGTDRATARATANASSETPAAAPTQPPEPVPAAPAEPDPAAATATPPGSTPAAQADSAPAAASAPTAEPVEAAGVVAEAERPKIEHPAAATKKAPVRPKLVTRPIVRPAVARPPRRALPGTTAAIQAPPSPAPAVVAVEGQASQIASGLPIEAEPPAEPPPVPAAPAEVAVVAPVAPAPAPSPVVVPARPTVKPANPGALDATPSVASVEVKGALSTAIVKRSIERALPALRTCYRTAARAVKATPALELRLSFEIDENNLTTQVAVGGASFGSLANCATAVASQIRTQEAPDVGTAQVTAVIRFRPS